MKTVITYGTFDLLHYGHIEVLRRAKELAEGGKLIVAVSTDELNWKYKKKKSHQPYEVRKRNVEALRYVDLVIPEAEWETQKREDVKKYDVDLFVIGDDWKGEFDFLKELCEVQYLPRTKTISSTLLRKVINELEAAEEEVK